MVTSEELMDAGGVDRRTLTQLQQLGVIPKPLKRTAPGGRGLKAYWPDSAAETMREVHRLRSEGRPLVEIAQRLTRSVAWGEASDRATSILSVLDRPFTTEGVSVTHTGREWVLGHLTDHFRLFGLEPDRAERLAREATDDARLGWALTLLLVEVAPVLVLLPYGRLYVTADFLVSHEISVVRKVGRLMAEPEDAGDEPEHLIGAAKGCIVLPLASLLWDTLRRCGAQLDFPVRLAPGETLRHFQDDAIVDRRYVAVRLPPESGGLYAFTLLPGQSRVEAGGPGRDQPVVRRRVRKTAKGGERRRG